MAIKNTIGKLALIALIPLTMSGCNNTQSVQGKLIKERFYQESNILDMDRYVGIVESVKNSKSIITLYKEDARIFDLMYDVGDFVNVDIQKKLLLEFYSKVIYKTK